MIVDAHHHLWRIAGGYSWLDEASLAPIRRDFGVDDLHDAVAGTGVERTVLVEAARCDAAEVREHLAAADACARIGGVVGWADLTDPALADTLGRHRDEPGGRWLVGIRDQVQGRTDPDFLARAEVHRGLSTVAAAGLAYDLVVRVDQLPAAATAALAVPQLRFVLDHLGKPRIRDGAAGLAQWRAAVTPLAAASNVSAKLSGLVTEADWAHWTVADLRPFVLAALELFGPHRLMFGSDWPVCLLAASYDRVLAALGEVVDDHLNADERAAVYGGTATRVYGLEH